MRIDEAHDSRDSTVDETAHSKAPGPGSLRKARAEVTAHAHRVNFHVCVRGDAAAKRGPIKVSGAAVSVSFLAECFW